MAFYQIIEVNFGNGCVSGIPQFHSGVCVEQSIILIHTSVSPMVVMLPSLCLT